MKEIKRIKWESENGCSVELTSEQRRGTESQYILKRLDGNGVTGEANSVKTVGGDGVSTYSITRSARDISLEGTVISYGNKDKWVKETIAENRDYLARCFDPKYFGTLYYYMYRGDAGRKIWCRPTALPVFEEDFNNSTKFKVGFMSDDPMWSLTIPIGAAMGMSMKNFRFPYYMFPTANGFTFTRAIIRNPTPYDIKPVLTVYGNEKAIEIYNKTIGAFLKFRQAVGKDERIIIDTKRARAYLEIKDTGSISTGWKYSKNVMILLSLSSDLTKFAIAPGENEFIIEKQMPQSELTLVVSGDVPVIGV